MFWFIPWGAVTAVLLIHVIYGNTLSIREDDELYLNNSEDHMMAGEQRVLIAKMDPLKRAIIVLAIFSEILLVASAGLWVWIGLHQSNRRPLNRAGVPFHVWPGDMRTGKALTPSSQERSRQERESPHEHQR